MSKWYFHLPTMRLPREGRQAVRFVIVGVSGIGIQYAFYSVVMAIFTLAIGDPQVSLSFTIGFVLEMVTNYILQSYYVFMSKPNLKNAGGFLCARAFNYVLQMAFLWLIMWMGLDEYWSGIISINLAGIINYFVLRKFFKKQKPNTTNHEDI